MRIKSVLAGFLLTIAILSAFAFVELSITDSEESWKFIKKHEDKLEARSQQITKMLLNQSRYMDGDIGFEEMHSSLRGSQKEGLSSATLLLVMNVSQHSIENEIDQITVINNIRSIYQYGIDNSVGLERKTILSHITGEYQSFNENLANPDFPARFKEKMLEPHRSISLFSEEEITEMTNEINEINNNPDHLPFHMNRVNESVAMRFFLAMRG